MRQWAEANTPQNNAAQFHQIDAPAESTNNSRAAKSNIFLVSQVKNLTIQIWGKKNNPTNWAHQQRYISTAQCRCGGAKISQTSLNFIFHQAIRKLSPQTNSLSSPNQANNGSVQKSTTVYRTIKTKRINIWDTRGAGSSTAPGRIRSPRRDAVPFAGSQTRIHHGGADRRARPRIGGGEGRRAPRWQESPRSIRGGRGAAGRREVGSEGGGVACGGDAAGGGGGVGCDWGFRHWRGGERSEAVGTAAVVAGGRTGAGFGKRVSRSGSGCCSEAGQVGPALQWVERSGARGTRREGIRWGPPAAHGKEEGLVWFCFGPGCKPTWAEFFFFSFSQGISSLWLP